ncbi:hypothetical protein ABZP36_032359 [Zizania latifolia]
MAEPTAAADIAAPPPAPEATATATATAMATVVAEQKVSHTAPQPDVPAPPPPAKKRKLEEVGFHTSSYYKIRAAVADLRVRFVQVYEATDFRNNDAACEILKEIKVVMELSKKMRLDLGGATFEPAKPPEKPLAGAVKDGQTEPAPSGEKNHVPQTGQTKICPNIANDGAQTNPNLEGAAEKMVEETQSSEIADHPKELDEIAQGSCVTGGSPIGWNFLVWPGGKVVYYGLTKEEFLARQAAN